MRVTRIAAAIMLEQVVMQPINYGLYIIPLTTVLKGGGLATIASEVRATSSSLVLAYFQTPPFFFF